MSKKVSIIIPVHNSAQYLEKCLASIAAQTYKNIEIILVDDDSTDSSLSICNDFVSRESRAILKPLASNIGAGFTRNAGMELATGEYIVFIDADDFIEFDMIEKLVSSAEKTRVELVIASYRTFEENNRLENRVFDSCVLCSKAETDKLFIENFPDGFVGYLWNKLYLKSVIDENGIQFTNMNRLEDALFNISYFSCINSCAVISDVVYNYRKSTQFEAIQKVPEDYVELVTLVYDTFVAMQESDAYLRRISQFYYSEIGTYIENAIYNSGLVKGFALLRKLRKQICNSNVPMFDNINIYRRALVRLLKFRMYLGVHICVMLKVQLKKKYTGIFFVIKDGLEKKKD